MHLNIINVLILLSCLELIIEIGQSVRDHKFSKLNCRLSQLHNGRGHGKNKM